jgi:hypothetical protein
MKLAAAALGAAMLFLFVALGGLGSGTFAPQRAPDAILLPGNPASAGTASTVAPTGTVAPLVAVARNVLALQLSQTGATGPASPAAPPAARTMEGGGGSSSAPAPAAAAPNVSAQTVPGATTLIPANPEVSTSIGPPLPAPTPTPTSTATPSPGPSPTAAPPAGRR